jgi:hypothetical protein
MATDWNALWQQRNERQRHFMTTLYHAERGRAGLSLTEALKVQILSENVVAVPTAKTKYTCCLEAAVKSQADIEADVQALAEAMRERYGKRA